MDQVRYFMSAQLIELLVFAGVAAVLVTKLISILGVTDENDQDPSLFGERGLKDVTCSSKIDIENILNKKRKSSSQNLGDILTEDCENHEELVQNLQKITCKLPKFDPRKFVKGAVEAFKMIISSVNCNNKKDLDSLVDKRFLAELLSISDKYGSINKKKVESLVAKISNVYFFGNMIFIKVLFLGDKITTKVNSLQEEWTFSKSAISEGPNWNLNNIELV